MLNYSDQEDDMAKQSDLEQMMASLERRLAGSDASSLAVEDVRNEASRIIGSAPPEDVARINRLVGELLERYGVMPENPGAAG